jgi:uncharacterized protein YciI
MSGDRVEVSKIIEASAPSLRLQLYLVHSNATSLEAVKQNLTAHRAYLRQLEDRNVLFAAGPLWTEDGEYFEGDGLLIYRAQSVAEAIAIATADPMHTSGARNFTIRPWLLNDGSINMRVILSEQKRELF